MTAPGTARTLELSIDSASALASIALTREGTLVVEHTWDCGREHSRRLLPAIDAMLRGNAATKSDLSGVFVNVGPGSYAGLRAGVSTAKALAHGLEIDLVGIGRLEIEAYAFAGAAATVVGLHEAGRAHVAWAAYESAPVWREATPPTITAKEATAAALPKGALVTGDISNALAATLANAGVRVVRGAAAIRRGALLAELGQMRLRSGRRDDPKTLVPVYLRDPAIGPQS
jgi:tRNA threonylcarbamoyladenosine biosynthesis protein TsaB